MEELITCLQDAGCAPALIAEICRLWENGNRELAVKRLRRQRCALMDEVHGCQRKVDCLDFLLQKMAKSQTNNSSLTEEKP